MTNHCYLFTTLVRKKPWMNSDIMESILTKINHHCVVEKHSIVLLMDNAGCHPEDLKSKLPANTSSKLQPLDLGIIQNFKVH